jgi:hypothetical protein
MFLQLVGLMLFLCGFALAGCAAELSQVGMFAASLLVMVTGGAFAVIEED